MELLFDRQPKDSILVGEQTVRGGEVFEIDDDTGARLLSNPAYHCRVPGPEPEVPEPVKPRGRRRIPDPIVAGVEAPEPELAAGDPEPEPEPETPDASTD